MFAEDLSVCVFSLQRDVVKGTVKFTLYPVHILMLSSFFCFYFPDQVNVAHYL